MKNLQHLFAFFAAIFIVASCEKEYSTETGSIGGIVQGTFSDTNGDCQPVTIRGNYYVDSVMTDSNYVIIQLVVSSPGSYTITTDVQNGYSFRDSGFIATAGTFPIRLKAVGSPIDAETSIFTAMLGTQAFCFFSVAAIPGISGPPAVYRLNGSTTNCGSPTIQGTYTTGTPLNASNFVNMQVNVTQAGAYNVNSTPTNGVTFSASGTFATTGVQTLTLQGSGTPTSAVTTNIPITVGSTSCSFILNVSQGSTTGNPNVADSAWQFKEAAKTFYGPFIDVYDTTIAQVGYGLAFDGVMKTSNDTTFSMGVLFPGNTITTGTYNTNNLNAYLYLTDNKNNVDLYSADVFHTGSTVQIIITAYDPNTRIITGTFSGNAINASNTAVPLTQGKFRAYVR